MFVPIALERKTTMQADAPDTVREYAMHLEIGHDNIFLDEPFLIVMAAFLIPMLFVILIPKFGKTLTVLGGVIAAAGMSYALYIHHAPEKEEQYTELANMVVRDINSRYHIQQALFEVDDNTATQLLSDDGEATIDIDVMGETFEYSVNLNDDGNAVLAEPLDENAPPVESITIAE